MSNTNADQRDRVLGDPDGAVQQPSPITAAFLTDLQRIVPPEDLGEAWMFAQRCARNYNSTHRGNDGQVTSFRRYFYDRWRFRRIDLYRAEHGRDIKRAKKQDMQRRKLKVRCPFTNAPNTVFTRRAIGPDRTVEHNDTIAHYKRRCLSRAHAMVVDCITSGLMQHEIAAALGVCESRVSQHVSGLKYIFTERMGTRDARTSGAPGVDRIIQNPKVKGLNGSKV